MEGKKYLFKKNIWVKVAIISLMLIIQSVNFQLTIENQPNEILYKSNASQTRSDQWILDLQENYNNPAWFYQNLNTTDRLMIRQAMDYAMPRQAIIDSILNGFGSLLATYEVPQVGKFYNSSVKTLPYDTAISIKLLTEVFGYTYSANTDNPKTPYNETFPYFPLNLMVPNSNPLRVQWANFIVGILKSIGIGVTLSEVSFGTEINRAFPTDSSFLGRDFTHGGFDGIFIGWGRSSLPDDGSYFYDSNYIPNYNYQNVNSSVIDNIIQQENNPQISTEARINAFKELQQYIANQSLKYILAQSVNPYIYSHGLKGFNQFFANNGSLPYQNITIGSANSMAIGVPKPYSNLMPLISGDKYSNYVIKNLWAGGLFGFSTIPNDPNQNDYSVYPNIAYSNYTISGPDGTNNTSPIGMFYNFTIKPGIMWADGSELTAQDVQFSYQQDLTPNRNTVAYGLLAHYMNNQSIIVYNKYHIGFNLTTWADPFPFGKNLFTQTIIPKITYNIADWKNSSFNTGINLNDTMYNSNGPYQLSSIDPTTGSVHLTVNPLYNATKYIFQDDGGATNETYAQYVSHVPGFNITPTLQSVSIKIENDSASALADLKANNINYVDTNVGLSQIYSSFLPDIRSGTIDESNVSGTIFQELGLNQASPIWGFSPQSINPGPPPTSISTFVPPPQGTDISNLVGVLFVGVVILSTAILILKKILNDKKR